MDFASYLAVLRRRMVPLALCVLAGLAGGYKIGHGPTKTYHATSRALVTLPPSAQSANTISSLNGLQLSSNLVPTFAAVATSRSVVQKVDDSLNLGVSVEELQRRLSATVEADTLIIDIRASDSDPARAASIADATTNALSERVSELQEESLQKNPVQVQLLDHAATPKSPVSPRPGFDLLLGLALGVTAGLLLIGMLEALDRTIKTSAQGDGAFQVPLLGVVPRRRRRRRREVIMPGDSIDSEPYRALRTAVRFTALDADPQTFLVTSPTPGDGKTTTVANLALALAAGGESVVVVDADLRRGTLGGVFGLESAVGLSSLVLRSATLDEALQPWQENVWVLPSGRPLPPNPSELLGSHLIANLLEELGQRFDVVLIDTPPVLPVTDAVALATQVDAVLLVTRYGATGRGAAAEARRRLEAVGARMIGYVINAVPSRERGAHYADYTYS